MFRLTKISGALLGIRTDCVAFVCVQERQHLYVVLFFVFILLTFATVMQSPSIRISASCLISASKLPRS